MRHLRFLVPSDSIAAFEDLVRRPPPLVFIAPETSERHASG